MPEERLEPRHVDHDSGYATSCRLHAVEGQTFCPYKGLASH